MKKDEIVFLIRAFNESEIIEKVLISIIDFWYSNILIVDDWSTDNTDKVVWKIMQSNKNSKIIYLKHLFNRWWWASLETWFDFIREFWKSLWYKYVFTFDADWQHDVLDSEKFIAEMRKNNDLDIILWSRFIEKTNTNVPLFRRLILYIWTIFTYIISWINLTDSHNWYRFMKIWAVDKIRLTMDWMEYASELIELIKVNNLVYKEVPVNIRYTKYSLEKWQKSSNAINIALKMIWNKFFK